MLLLILLLCVSFEQLLVRLARLMLLLLKMEQGGADVRAYNGGAPLERAAAESDRSEEAAE